MAVSSRGRTLRRLGVAFPDCERQGKVQARQYRAFAKAAGFKRDLWRGRMVVELLLFPEKKDGLVKRPRKRSTRKR